MNEDQVKHLISAIKNLYPKFSDKDGTIKEWVKRLIEYDNDDVMAAFENWVDAGYEEPPQFTDLTYGLIKVNNKTQLGQGLYKCCDCGKNHKSIDELEKCHERDLRIRYIRKMCKKFNLKEETYFYENLNHLSLEDINSRYDNFMNELFKLQKEQGVLIGGHLEGLRVVYANIYKKIKE